MSQVLRSLSFSFHHCPIGVRERVALSPAQGEALLEKVRDFSEAQEALLLSTCNRTELYYLSEAAQTESILSLLGIIKGLGDTGADLLPHAVLREGSEAVAHLFEVSVGLDAQVLGDLQVTGQVKRAYQQTADLNLAGPYLHRLLHTIFFASKRIVQETEFRDGAASVAYASSELLKELTAQVKEPRVLLVGAGDIGKDVVRNLQAAGFQNVTLMNRTRERAETLAAETGFRVADYADLKEELKSADALISSVGADTPIFTKALLEETVDAFKVLIDLSVPRSIDPEVEAIAGVLLYNVDDIQSKTSEAHERRRAAIPRVKDIITEAQVEFEAWSKEMIISPTLQALKESLEQIRRGEIEKALRGLSAEESEKVEKITLGITKQILKLHALKLKAACQRDDAENLIEALQELFNLELQPTPPKSE